MLCCKGRLDPEILRLSAVSHGRTDATFFLPHLPARIVRNSFGQVRNLCNHSLPTTDVMLQQGYGESVP